MLDKINRLAERTATQASRRQFLNRFGRSAMALAAAVGGLLACAEDAHAARRARCCYYRCGGRGGTWGHYVCHSDGGPCSRTVSNRGASCVLRSESLIRSCDNCRSY